MKILKKALVGIGLTILVLLVIILGKLRYDDWYNRNKTIEMIEPLYSNIMSEYAGQIELKEIDNFGEFRISFNVIKEDCTAEDAEELALSVDNYVCDYLKKNKNHRLNLDHSYELYFYLNNDYVSFTRVVGEDGMKKEYSTFENEYIKR